MRKYFVIFSVILLFISPAVAGEIDASNEANLSEELKAGKAKVATLCSACHGINGKADSGGNSPNVPNLFGQKKGYLEAKLLDYKSGKLQHEQMTLISQMITEEDIKNVSIWYSSIKVEVFDPNVVLMKSE